MSKNRNPLVSVVIPVYNVEKYIRACLDSVLEQTYKNIEIIVVSDASPGGIAEIIEEYQNHHENIKYVELKKNVGLFRARVEGMRRATGDYIINIDGDDMVCIDYVARLVYRAEETGADIVLSEMVRYSEKDRSKHILNLAKSIEYDEVVRGEAAAFAELLRKGNFFWEVCGKLYSRSVVDAAMKDLRNINRHILMGEDMLFNFHLFYHCKILARTEFAFYYYLINDGSITAKNANIDKKERVLSDLVFVFDVVKKFMEQKGVFGKYERQYRYLRNMQAAKYYSEVHEDFSGKHRKKLQRYIEEIMYDKAGFEQEVALRNVDTIGDIKDLRWRLESMNSIKVSGLKFLSNIKRKLKSMVSR